MPQQNNNPNVRQQNQDGKDQPPKTAPGHDNRPQKAQDNNQGDKPGKPATSNRNGSDDR